MRAQPANHTLQPTAVVHEAFVRLAHRDPSEFQDEEHFMATAATVLRTVLVDHARRRLSDKRGGGKKVSISSEDLHPIDPTVAVGAVIALEDALEALAKKDPRSAKVAEMRIFGALTVDHIARLLTISVATVERDWRIARAWIEQQYAISTAHAKVEL